MPTKNFQLQRESPIYIPLNFIQENNTRYILDTKVALVVLSLILPSFLLYSQRNEYLVLATATWT